MLITWLMTIFASLLFTLLFITQGFGCLDFWWLMSVNILILLIGVAILDKGWRQELLNDFKTQLFNKVTLGFVFAIILYVVFYVGNILSRQIFAFAGSSINAVYQFKTSASPIRIALLMIFLIGPGEELFWRGFLQRRLSLSYGPLFGFLISTAIYTLIHVGSGNPMLVLAAGICGLFWGGLYLKYRSLVLNIVSHTVWDVCIFLLYPVG